MTLLNGATETYGTGSEGVLVSVTRWDNDTLEFRVLAEGHDKPLVWFTLEGKGLIESFQDLLQPVPTERRPDRHKESARHP